MLGNYYQAALSGEHFTFSFGPDLPNETIRFFKVSWREAACPLKLGMARSIVRDEGYGKVVYRFSSFAGLSH